MYEGLEYACEMQITLICEKLVMKAGPLTYIEKLWEMMWRKYSVISRLLLPAVATREHIKRRVARLKVL